MRFIPLTRKGPQLLLRKRTHRILYEALVFGQQHRKPFFKGR
jgi:hypothetical protein